MLMSALLLPKKDQMELLALARNALQTALQIPSPSIQTQVRKNRGLFTTIWFGKEIRGCIGTPYPDLNKSLEETVQEFTLLAALEDPRFLPVTKEILPQVEIEISILTSPQPIKPNQIQIGTHGLIITHGEQAGLLLPQIPLEYGWDINTYLEQLCIKADLSPETWKREAVLTAFETQIFRENH